MGAQIWVKWSKIGPKIRFFVTFSSLVHQFSWKLHRMIDWNIVQIKPLKKKLGGPKLGSKLRQGFCHFLKVSSLFFPDIGKDCSLGQDLAASRAKTSKKNFLGQNLDRDELSYSNVIEHPLRLACFSVSLWCLHGLQ